MTRHTERLADFLAGLRFDAIPAPVIRRTEDLLLDWLGSALAGKGMHPTPVFEHYADRMGPASGPCRILVSGKTSTPHFAAMVNGAGSHLVEQDDVHNGSVFHPAVRDLAARVAMQRDDEVDAAYPGEWLGRVTVTTRDGRRFCGAVDSPKGDPDNTLSRPELEDKFLRLCAFSHAAGKAKARELIEKVWTIAGRSTLGDIFDVGGKP